MRGGDISEGMVTFYFALCYFYQVSKRALRAQNNVECASQSNPCYALSVRLFTGSMWGWSLGGL